MSIRSSLKHIYNSIVNIFYDDSNLLVVVSALFGIVLIVMSFLLNVETAVFYIVLSGDSQTIASLLSILYASIAIIMAISSSTQSLSDENSRWLQGMLKVIQQFRRPIISSMLLVFVLFFCNSTIAIIELNSWYLVIEAILTFMIVFLSVHVTICTLILSLSMINYIKAEFLYSNTSEVNYIIVENETDFTEAFTDCIQDARRIVLEIVDCLDGLTRSSKSMGTESYLPSNHASFDQLSQIIFRLDLNEDDAREIYKSTMEKNTELADRVTRTNAEMHKLVTDLSALTSDMKLRAENLGSSGKEFIGCSKVSVIKKRLGINDSDDCSVVDDLSKISADISRNLTLISSNIIKFNRCLNRVMEE